jgi:hypothetical protein
MREAYVSAENQLWASCAGEPPIMSIEVKRHYATSSSWPIKISNATSPSIAVRLLLGVILLVAASLKGYELATGPIAENSLPWRRWFFIAVVEVELFLGLWLLSGICVQIIQA